MRSHTMNATGLGSKSFQNDTNVTLSPRLELYFDCPADHHFSITFSAEASMPTSWDCPSCWAHAGRSDGVPEAAEPDKSIRTPWMMLRERRSIAELEELLDERLLLLKSGVIGPGIAETVAPRRR